MIEKFYYGFLNRVYGYDDYTQLEINSKLIQKIDEVIDECNNAFEFVDWLKEQGVPDEVQTIIDTMLEDGTLEDLINVEKFNSILKQCKEEVKNAKTSIDQMFYNVLDFEGVIPDGLTDVTSALQVVFNKVKENGGGTIIFPQGEYYIRNYVDVYSNTKVIFNEGCIISKRGGLGSQTTFAINRIADGQPYGYTAKNISFEGGIFNGFKNGMGFVVQKVKNLTFKNIKFIDCMTTSHVMDLQAVYNCTIENCVFEGRYMTTSQSDNFRECIQYDITSKPGAPSFSGADGTVSFGIKVRNCVFKPNDNDVESLGFVAIGTHSSWDLWQESIIFENNIVIDSPYYMVRFPNVSDITIKGNKFINKSGKLCGAIRLDGLSPVYQHSQANLASPSQTVDGKYYSPKNIIITNNSFEGFKNEDLTTPIVYIQGRMNYPAKGIIISNNSFVNCTSGAVNGQECISLVYADNATVSNNIFNTVRRAIYSNNSSNINLINNAITDTKSSAISIYNTNKLCIKDNVINTTVYEGIAITNCENINITSNALYETGVETTNASILLTAPIQAFVANNMLINENRKSAFGTRVQSSSNDSYNVPKDIILSNNLYKGTQLCESFEDEKITGTYGSGFIAHGFKLISADKTDGSYTSSSITINE